MLDGAGRQTGANWRPTLTAETRPIVFDRRSPLAQRLWDAPRARTLVDMLSAPAALAPEAVALGLMHHGGPPEEITWAELWLAARDRAAQLRASGVRTGDRVILLLPTCRAFFAAFFGALAAGAVPVPLAPPPSMRLEKIGPQLDAIARILGDTDAAAVVGLSRPQALLEERVRRSGLRARVISADDPVSNPPLDDVPIPDEQETAFLQYTSGSTSDPKGVELTHANLIANVAAIAKAITGPVSVGISWLPLHHDMGLIGTCLAALYSRTPVVFMPPQAFIKDPAVWLRTISASRGTITIAPSFAYSYCAKNVSIDDLAGVQLDSLELAMNGAEPIDLTSVREFEAKFAAIGLRPGVVRPVYGLAESSLAVSFGDPGPARSDVVDADRLERSGCAARAASEMRTRTFVSVGTPLVTQAVCIADEEDRRLPERQVGEILVRGPSVMKGYFRKAEESTRALRNGWLHTGDLGYIADGQLYITGRLKDLIIRNGKNYYGQDIERCIADTPGLIDGGAVVFGIDEQEPSRVVIIAETRARDGEAREAIRRRIRQACHDAFLFGPDEVRLVAPGAIPRTTSGKVRRQACKRWYQDVLIGIEVGTDADTDAGATSPV